MLREKEGTVLFVVESMPVEEFLMMVLCAHQSVALDFIISFYLHFLSYLSLANRLKTAKKSKGPQ